MRATAQRKPRGRAKAASEAPRGRNRPPAKGDRVNRTQLAERLKLDRKTVSKYLALDGAPTPDRKFRYSVEECRAYFEKVVPRLPSQSEEHRALKLALLRMEAEDRQLDLEERRRELVRKKDIEPTIVAMMTGLTDNLRNKFEGELPDKYEGKTTAERAKLNAEAIDWVLQQLKAAAWPLTGGPK